MGTSTGNRRWTRVPSPNRFYNTQNPRLDSFAKEWNTKLSGLAPLSGFHEFLNQPGMYRDE